MTITSNKGTIESTYGGLKEEINGKRWFIFYADSPDSFSSTFNLGDIVVISFSCCEYKGVIDNISTTRLQDNLYQIYFSLAPQNCIYSKYD